MEASKATKSNLACSKHEAEDWNHFWKRFRPIYGLVWLHLSSNARPHGSPVLHIHKHSSCNTLNTCYQVLKPDGRNGAAGFNHSWRSACIKSCINMTLNKTKHLSRIYYCCCHYKANLNNCWLHSSGSWRWTLLNLTNICQRSDS